MNNKIEKLSYEELIKALDCCAHTLETNMCGECPAAKYEAGTCDDMVKLQAAEMLKALKAENEKLNRKVNRLKKYDECRNICPFEDDCECEECDNANERIFNTEISSIFNNGLGWKVTFKNLSCIEASFTDIGTSFFVGENAEQQAKEAEQKLKEMRGG